MSTRRERRAQDIARAAVQPLGENGLHSARLADIGESIGMTGAHLLYYFDSKTALFLAALRTVENDLKERTEEAFEQIHTARGRWEWMLDAATPVGEGDPNLALWVEAWAAAAHDDEVREVVASLEKDWQRRLHDVLEFGIVQRRLHDVLEFGIERGELPGALDIPAFVQAFSALLDGLALRVVVPYGDLTREDAMAVCRAFTDSFLLWTAPADAAVAATVLKGSADDAQHRS